MEHYIATGEVLGKDTDNLEGYALPDKGYFGPRRLPQFDVEFFDMPRGKIEDRLLDEFKEKLQRANEGGKADETQLWAEFQQKMAKAVLSGKAAAEIGMDSAG